MKPLAKLFTLKQPTTPPPATRADEKRDAELELSHFEKGYADCKGAHGNSTIFRTALEANYQAFKDQCRKDMSQQEELKAPHLRRKVELEGEKDKRTMLKGLREEKLNALDADAHKIDVAIAEVKTNPHKYGLDATRRPKVQFYMGVLLILPITLYLIVFYISASYSAFFKDFDSTKVFAAIFDAQAYRKAMDEGTMEGIFVCTIPFVFMGLGYLIHMFQNARSRMWKLKLVLLFTVTFIFDLILAYLIENKIYDFNKTLDSAPYNFRIAISTVDFWGIIFAGFLVYIIWGLVFDFIMKEHENLDRIEGFIRQKIEEKRLLLEKRKLVEAELDKIRQDISEIDAGLSKEKQLLDGFIFPNRKYLSMHTHFKKGWEMALSKEIALPHSQKEQLLAACNLESAGHMKEHEIANEDAESVAFTSKNKVLPS